MDAVRRQRLFQLPLGPTPRPEPPGPLVVESASVRRMLAILLNVEERARPLVVPRAQLLGELFRDALEVGGESTVGVQVLGAVGRGLATRPAAVGPVIASRTFP